MSSQIELRRSGEKAKKLQRSKESGQQKLLRKSMHLTRTQKTHPNSKALIASMTFNSNIFRKRKVYHLFALRKPSVNLTILVQGVGFEPTNAYAIGS